MSETIHISEEAYRALSELARQQGQTPEALVETWVTQHAESAAGGRDPYTDPRYYSFEEFFLHLGMTKAQIEKAVEAAEHDDADV